MRNQEEFNGISRVLEPSHNIIVNKMVEMINMWHMAC